MALRARSDSGFLTHTLDLIGLLLVEPGRNTSLEKLGKQVFEPSSFKIHLHELFFTNGRLENVNSPVCSIGTVEVIKVSGDGKGVDKMVGV